MLRTTLLKIIVVFLIALLDDSKSSNKDGIKTPAFNIIGNIVFSSVVKYGKLELFRQRADRLF
jgi:hypothetical protein